jgi:hypothetical protein
MAIKRLVVAAAFTLSGCAGLSTGSLVDDTTNKQADGFRYFETSPFLLLTSDGKGGLKSKVLYLPDSTKLRTIKPYSFAAKNDTTLTFKEGTLVQAKSVVDETIVPASIVGALEKVAIANLKANAPATSIPSPYLFRIYNDGAGNWSLNGGQALEADNTPVRIRFMQK